MSSLRLRALSLPLLLVFGLLALSACSDESSTSLTAPEDFEAQFPVNDEMPGVQTEFSLSKASGDIVDTAVAAGFETLVAAVQAADLEGALRGDGPYTVFAPTDEAFAKLPEGLVAQLLLPENKAKLQQILLYHVVEGRVGSRDLRFYQKVPTLEGSSLKILRFWRLVVVNGNPVVTADVQATNGVIHVINEVLIPEGFTLDDPPAPTMDIVDTAVDAGFSTLVAAVQAADLEGALRGEGPLTVFAPTNEAFDKLPEGLVADLLKPENKSLLTELLLYHVTSGAIFRSDLEWFQRVDMLAGGKTYVFNFPRAGVYANYSRVITADIAATNGVVHVIDRVLIPRSFYGRVSGLPAEAPEYGAHRFEMVEDMR